MVDLIAVTGKLQKGGILCREETEQGRAARDVVPAEVWGEDKVEAEWAARSPRGRVEIASVQIAAPQCHTLPESLAIRKLAPSVAR